MAFIYLNKRALTFAKHDKVIQYKKGSLLTLQMNRTLNKTVDKTERF